jgi:hypothetical protein
MDRPIAPPHRARAMLWWAGLGLLGALLAGVVLSGCHGDSCPVAGRHTCIDGVAYYCDTVEDPIDDGPFWKEDQDCAAAGLQCVTDDRYWANCTP